MSPIGRIFIVLNLILSAAFLGWASNALTTNDEYKTQLEQAKADSTAALAAKDAELSKLSVELRSVTDQQAKFREERDQNGAKADRLQTQLDELKRAGEQMQANLTKIEATLGDYNATIAQLTQQKDAAVERAHEAERARDDAVQSAQDAALAQSRAEELTNAANTAISDLENEKVALLDEVSKLETRLAVVVSKTGVALSEIEAPQAIDAFVLDVNKDLKLVVFNKGAKDGVKAGYTFDVYKGQQYKGRVRIQDVQDGMSSGLITSEKVQIARGDSATTRL